LECIKAVRGAGARTVREIASRCNTSPATVSRYMKILRLSGQVEVWVRVGRAEGFREVYRALGRGYVDIVRVVAEGAGGL
jgi:DNA-binding transcriptional regulator LsrR (DeoR family)